MEHYRAPLLDCTNGMYQAGEVGNRARKSNMKGQWKRRARMQSTGNANGVSNIQSKVEDENLKRSRGSTDENLTEDYGLQGRKKIKVMT